MPPPTTTEQQPPVPTAAACCCFWWICTDLYPRSCPKAHCSTTSRSLILPTAHSRKNTVSDAPPPLPLQQVAPPLLQKPTCKQIIKKEWDCPFCICSYATFHLVAYKFSWCRDRRICQQEDHSPQARQYLANAFHLSGHLNTNKYREKQWDPPFFDAFMYFLSSCLPIFILPEWTNSWTGVFDPPGTITTGQCLPSLWSP